jgi:hypothetical protein
MKTATLIILVAVILVSVSSFAPTAQFSRAPPTTIVFSSDPKEAEDESLDLNLEEMFDM